MVKFKNETNNKQQTKSNKSIFSFAKSYIKQKYKIILLLTTLTLIISVSQAFSKFYNEQVLVKAQNTPTLTVSVEKYTQNHLPNITGNCTIGDNLLFTIKKGNTGVVSETIARTCTVSPYSLTPTISLPDGKYKVSVKVNVITGACPVTNNTIEGTTGDDTIYGTAENDLINGNGGLTDFINGGPGCDTIYAGNAGNPNSANAYLKGDGGDDMIYGGLGCTTSIGYLTNPNSTIELVGELFKFGKIVVNAQAECSPGLIDLNGSNDTLRGVGEKDVLIGNTLAGVNFFELSGGGCPNNDYYIGNGDNDFAKIKNFEPFKDIILISSTTTSISSYNITFANGVSNLYYNGDLIAKIDSTVALDINSNYFSGQCQGQ